MKEKACKCFCIICCWFLTLLSNRLTQADEMTQKPHALKVTAFANYGICGPRRDRMEIVAEENIHFTAQIHGLKQNKEGDYCFDAYSEILGADSKVLFTNPLEPQIVRNHCAGSDVFFGASYKFPKDQPSGNYQVRIHVFDKVSEEQTSSAFDVAILPSDTLGAADIGFFSDANLTYPAGGQTHRGSNLWFSFCLVGFQTRDRAMSTHIRIYGLDADGKRIGPDLLSDLLRDPMSADPVNRGIPVKVPMMCYREGCYQLVLELEDQMAQSMVTYQLPITIHNRPTFDNLVNHNNTSDLEKKVKRGDLIQHRYNTSEDNDLDKSKNQEQKDMHVTTVPGIIIKFEPAEGSHLPAGKVLTGDRLIMEASIKGLSVAESENIDCRFNLSAQDPTGGIFVNSRGKFDFRYWQGVDDFPARYYFSIGLDSMPGKHTISMRTFDNQGKTTAESSAEYEVIKNDDFRICAVKMLPDQNSSLMNSGDFIAGNRLAILYDLVNYDNVKSPPTVKIRVSVLDESGKILAPNFFIHEDNFSERKLGKIKGMLNCGVFCTGKYLYRLEATDLSSGKTSTCTIPVVVWPQLKAAKEYRKKMG